MTKDLRDQVLARPAPTVLARAVAAEGHLEDLQVKHLEVWGRTLLIGMLGARSMELRIDPATKHVAYHLKGAPRQDPNLLAGLQRSITWLLGETWTQEIKTPGWTWSHGTRPTPARKRSGRSTNAKRKRSRT